MSNKINFHEKSAKHLTACLNYNIWRNNYSIDKNIEQNILQEKHYWKQVLHRLLRITLTLARSNIAFRGHSEYSEETYNGNFLEISYLLAEYDTVMDGLLKKTKGTMKYMSPSIQNELIDCLASEVEEHLTKKFLLLPFFL